MNIPQIIQRGLLKRLGIAIYIVVLAGLSSGTSAIAADDNNPLPVLANLPGLPPALGATEPKVVPIKGDDAMYHQSWFNDTFLNLRDDFNAAKAEGKRFVVIFEQRGCIYCVKMHKESLAKKYINDYFRKNFTVVQLNMWGDKEVTDFDGKVTTEKKLAARWGAVFTPTLIFFKDNLSGLDGKYGRPLEVVRLNQVGAGTLYDMFAWIKHKVYDKEPNFQRFHIERINQRRALKGEMMGTHGRKLKKPANAKQG